MAQWIYVNLAADFRNRGFNSLWFQFGGRPFDSHCRRVDINEGKRDGDPLFYSYDVRVDAETSATDDFENSTKTQILDALRDCDFSTAGNLAKRVRRDERSDIFRNALEELTSDGLIVAAKGKPPGAKRTYPGYRLKETDVIAELF